MDDYGDDFEVDEEIEEEVKPKVSNNKKKETTEKTTISSLIRNDSRETGIAKKSQPLSTRNQSQNDDLKKSSSALTLQPQEFSLKPKPKPFAANPSDPKRSSDSILISDFKQQYETRSSDKLMQKSPITSVFQSNEIKRPKNTFDEDKQHFPKKADVSQKKQYQIDDKPVSQQKESHTKLPHTTKASQLNLDHPNNYEQVQNLISSFPLVKNDREFDEENKQLRKQLRDMNNLLNNILLRQDITKLMPKKMTFKDKSVEDRIRTYNQEIKNNHKIMATRNDEYQMLKLRIEQIKDPKYPIKLKDKIAKTKDLCTQIRKENKQLELECRNAGKNIHKVESADGVPQSLQIANDRAREAAMLEEKNEQLATVIGAFQEQSQQQLETIQQLNLKILKLEELARYYHVPVDKNPLHEKYNVLSKEIREYEDGIKTMLNRNDKIMQNFFENELEELQYNIGRDKEYLANVQNMIQKQVAALKELLEKESMGDRSMKELFGRVQSALEEQKTKKEEQSKAQRDIKDKRPSIGKYMSERDELYKDLPLFSPSRNNPKKFAIRKGGKVRTSIRKSASPEEEDAKKNSEGDENLRVQPENGGKKNKDTATERNEKEKLVINEEPKISERLQEQPAQNKTEVSEEKRSFAKPFGVKKFANRSGNDPKTTETHEIGEEINKNSQETNAFKPLKINDKGSSDLNYVHEESLKLNNQSNQTLKLPGSGSGDVKNTKELTLQNNQMPQKNEELTLNGGQINNQNKELKLNPQDSIHEEIPTEDFGIGGSRMNRNRLLKKDNKNEPELNLNGGLKLNNDSNTNSELKLNDGFTSTKVENKGLTLGQKSNADEPGIKDPFAKYDDLSNIDFSKKTKNIALPENETKKLFTYKNNTTSDDKKPESKPLTLENPQQNQPFSFSQSKQPQLRLEGAGDLSTQNNTNTEGKTLKVFEDDSNKKNTLNLNFGEKPKADKEDGLSFLNDKSDGTEKKVPDLTLDNDEKKPKRMIINKKPEPAKENDFSSKDKTNDFFNDLDM